MISFDLEVRRGTFTVRGALATDARVSGLFGPTGSGKTSLLLAVAGLLRPTHGRVEIDGETLVDAGTGAFVPPEKRGVAVVFQEGRLFPHLTVRENLLYSPRSRPPSPAFDEIVQLLELEPLLDRPAPFLSGGQARLVAAARAILARPRLLLLDEPMTGLDPELRRRVLAHFLRLKERLDVRMLLVSHVFSDFLALVDEAALLREGRITRTGRPDELLGDALGLEGAGPAETTLTGLVASAAGDRIQAVCDGGAKLSLFVPHARPGELVYLTVRAQDVILGVGDPPLTSARNVLRGSVTRIVPAGDHALAAIDAGPSLWAEVTAEAVEALGLAPGREVYALIKASALRGVLLPRPAAVGQRRASLVE